MSNRTGIKLTPELLKSHIAEVIYEDRIIGGHRVMHCHFRMDNGFVVYGKKPSTSIDPDNFDVEMGKDISYKNTFDQLWEIEAYRALIEQNYLFEAIKESEIDISQYMIRKAAIQQDHLYNGHMQQILFRAPNDFSKGFVAEFVSSDNTQRDEIHNSAERKKVEQYIRLHTKVEDLNSALVVRIAKACHEANRGYCLSLGDESQLPWDKAPEWQRHSICNGVKFHLTGDRKPSESHESWLAEKEADGWVWGLVKDPTKKEHPCMVPYDQLPAEQKTKDYIFKSIVDSFK